MFKISLNRIHDTVQISEGNDSITLRVNGDPARMVAGLSEAQRRMAAVNEDTDPDEVKKTAEFFAGVIFGTEQTKTLMDFYRQDAGCVINICGKYFSERLKTLIIKAQKRIKR